ncbi:IBR domain-containing protein [Elsinoe fawcettii]|nr:IBR domain-containing protein [Elsinoe fawcettii]
MDDEREEEITSLSSIFPEIVVNPDQPHTISLDIQVAPSEEVTVISEHVNGVELDTGFEASVVKHLPPLRLKATLLDGYPDNVFPRVQLEARPAWIGDKVLRDLENECRTLWEEYGRCQILYTYIDHVQQAAERFFDLPHTITVKRYLREELVEFSQVRDKEIFEGSSYDCGVCLEPKKGTLCHRMVACGHVFCRACLQDFYNSAITEGDVGNITCLEPTCGKSKPGEPQKKRKSIHPRELLAIGISEPQARRYVELKRKKKLESDKSTIYCPRTWCQSAARSNKYPPIPDDLDLYIDDSSDEAGDPPPAYTKDTPENKLPVPADRLAICSNPKCLLAFCRVCYCGWHGEFARCWPRNPADLSEEEKASYDYIRQHTSPCPTCSSPVQKTMGCNHMKCFQCNTHFCYLCGAWLPGDNPYQHFNQKGNECYMRLWELEEGDEGQGNAHFNGARRWEQEAIDIAQRAQEEEDAAMAAREQVAEEREAQVQAPIAPPGQRIDAAARERHRQFFAPEGPPPGPIDPMHAMVMGMEAARLEEQEVPAVPWPVEEEAVMGGRRRGRGRNARDGADEEIAVPPPQAQRGRGRGRGGRRGEVVPARPGRGDGRILPGQVAAREAAALRRFVQMAQNDEEDEWDSDELEDDGMFEIR